MFFCVDRADGARAELAEADYIRVFGYYFNELI
jgi:hypothetical protein